MKLKDVIQIGAALAALILCLIFIPLPPLFRAAAGLVCAILIYLGLEYIFDPRTASDLAEAKYEEDFQTTISKILVVAQFASVAASLSKRSTARQCFNNISLMLTNLYERFKKVGRSEAVVASRLVILLNQLATKLDGYIKIQRGELFLATTLKKQKIDDMELTEIPMVERVIENLAVNLDQGRVSELEVADNTFETLAKTYGLLRDMSD